MSPHSLPAATRESAFVHAIASAGVAFAVTRSCAEGTSTICGCDSHHKGPPGEGWKWGGCSEDADFGVLVSREFADARENRPDARSAMNKHNNEAGRTVSHGRPRHNLARGPFLTLSGTLLGWPCPALPLPGGPCAFWASCCPLFPGPGLAPIPTPYPTVTPSVHPPFSLDCTRVFPAAVCVSLRASVGPMEQVPGSPSCELLQDCEVPWAWLSIQPPLLPMVV